LILVTLGAHCICDDLLYIYIATEGDALKEWKQDHNISFFLFFFLLLNYQTNFINAQFKILHSLLPKKYKEQILVERCVAVIGIWDSFIQKIKFKEIINKNVYIK